MLYEVWWRSSGTRLEGGVLLQEQRRGRAAVVPSLTILMAICCGLQRRIRTHAQPLSGMHRQTDEQRGWVLSSLLLIWHHAGQGGEKPSR